MHTVEAYLAAGAVTRRRRLGRPRGVDRPGDGRRGRAARLAVRGALRRRPGHPLPSYNRGQAARPVPAVRRHARPRVRVGAAAHRGGTTPPAPDPALTHAAVALFDRAVADTRRRRRGVLLHHGLGRTSGGGRAVPLGRLRGDPGRGRAAARRTRRPAVRERSTTRGGASPTSTSSTASAAPGGTSSRRTWSRRRRRGAASPTSTTRSTPACSPAGRFPRSRY